VDNWGKDFFGSALHELVQSTDHSHKNVHLRTKKKKKKKKKKTKKKKKKKKNENFLKKNQQNEKKPPKTPLV